MVMGRFRVSDIMSYPPQMRVRELESQIQTQNKKCRAKLCKFKCFTIHITFICIVSTYRFFSFVNYIVIKKVFSHSELCHKFC